MARKPSHKWAFRPGMRAGAFNWRGSAKAIEKLKAASAEIRSMAKVDPIVTGEGVIILAERIWPAFEHIDTSSGALGTAVRRTLEDLAPLLIAVPADAAVRAAWLERLRVAIGEDGVDYLAPLADRFGEIAAHPALSNDHAERDLALIRQAWADHERFSHIATAGLTLSCLLEAGRHEELLALLDVKKTRLWFDEKFAAEALMRQGREEEALARAAALLADDRQTWERQDIARFCEALLIRRGQAEEAYRRFALPTTMGNTWLAMWRDLVKRYSDIDPRCILEDLIALHGRKGKWFAAAKTAGYFDLALDCAKDSEAAPATLIRAARDYAVKQPAFAAEVALCAIEHLIAGRGYDAAPQNIDEAMDHLLAAGARSGVTGQILADLRRILGKGQSSDPLARRLRERVDRFAQGLEVQNVQVG